MVFLSPFPLSFFPFHLLFVILVGVKAYVFARHDSNLRILQVPLTLIIPHFYFVFVLTVFPWTWSPTRELYFNLTDRIAVFLMRQNFGP